MADEPDYVLDICGVEDEPYESTVDEARRAGKWIGVHFECCGVYARIYRNRRGTAYVGHCPRCQARVQVAIGPEGTRQRMFRAR